MRNGSSPLVIGSFILVTICILAVLTWTNHRFAVQNPGGNDFLPRWLGTRLLLTKGISPYSQETTLEIQKLIYGGRPAGSQEDQQLFVYPFYTTFLFAPFALIHDYNLARSVWMACLEIALILTALVSLIITQWRPSRFLLVELVLFSLFWYYGFRPLINGNPAVLCAFLIVLSFWAIREERDVLAGFILAWATIKPQMVILLAFFIFVWAFSHRRWWLIGSFLVTIGFLVILSTLLSPSWIADNLVQILAYPSYTQPGTPGQIFNLYFPRLGAVFGIGLSLIIVALLLWEWKRALGKDFRDFFWTASFTLVLTQLSGVRTETTNYVALLPVWILILKVWNENENRLNHALMQLTWGGLFFGLWWLFLATIQQSDQPVQSPVMFFPLPVLLWIGLYRIRQWRGIGNEPLPKEGIVLSEGG